MFFLRLCRPMCGRSLTFRKLTLVSGAAPLCVPIRNDSPIFKVGRSPFKIIHLSEGQRQSETFRTSGGGATLPIFGGE